MDEDIDDINHQTNDNDYDDDSVVDGEAMRRLRKESIAPNSRKIYNYNASRFIMWVIQHHSELINEGFKDKSIDYIKEYLSSSLDTTPPIKLHLLSPKVYIKYLDTLKRKSSNAATNAASSSSSSSSTGNNERNLSISSIKSHRAALSYLYAKYEIAKPESFEDKISPCIRGLNNILAHESDSVGVGKEPFEFSQMQSIALTLLKENNNENTFLHLYMLLTWNLMCRANNTGSIRYHHIDKKEDSVVIVFSHQKTDQLGKYRGLGKHLYANPFNPEICVFLSFGIFFLSYPPCNDGGLLFDGDKQMERFSKGLNRVLRSKDVEQELTSKGHERSDYGTHSFRKGAASYCCAGCTAGPPISSVHLRAGWKFGGVQDRYIKYEAAGDQYLGRVVSGLPITSPLFAILPPHFIDENSPLVKTTMTECFPSLPEKITSATLLFLASVVYHHRFILNTFPKTHPIFSNPLFTNKERIRQLYDLVKCDTTSNKMTSTGIPPHVGFSLQIKKVHDDLNEASTKIVGEIKDVIEERTVIGNVLTRQGAEQLLGDVEQRLLLTIDNRLTQIQPSNVVENSTNKEPSLYMYNGKLHMVPQSFILPNMCIQHAWQIYVCGNPSNNTPPLRIVRNSDMPTLNQSKRFSDYTFLMKKIEQYLQQNNHMESYPPNPTIEWANAMYLHASKSLNIEEATPKGRKRRMIQLRWSTAAKLVRIKEKNSLSLSQ